MLWVLGRELAYQPGIKWTRRFAYRIFGTLDVRAKIAAYNALPIILNDRDDQIILDAGCGRGVITFALARLKPQAFIIGVDIDPDKIACCQAIQRALNVTNIEFRCMDLARLNFSNLFDAVLCIDVLEHVSDDKAVLHSLLWAMKPGGRLILHTPLGERHNRRLLKLWRSYFQSFTADDPVFQRYNESNLSEKVTDAGFRIREVRFTYGIFGELAWEVDALATKVGFPLRLIAAPFVTATVLLDTCVKNTRFHNGILLIAEHPGD